MTQRKLPFNVKLLKLDAGQLRLLKPITTLDRFDGASTGNFHDKGLFSTEIFGRVGEDARDETFAYIPLKTKILHPVIYNRLERLKRLYIGILSGKQYATWDPKEKDFFPADETEGETGFQFFMSHWEEIEFPKGNSEIRKMRVRLMDKYRDEAVIENVLVMPAGLRDAEIDHLDRIQEHEINKSYQRLINISNTISKGSRNDSEVFNTARFAQQVAFNEIYRIIEEMLTGKKGFIQGKWGSRRIINGTRNVITSMDISTPALDADNYPGPDDTVLGLWQTSRGALPVTINRLQQGILSNAFGDVEGNVRLIDPKTLKSEGVQVGTQTYDRWTTTEGLEKVIASQSMVELRAKPVTIENRYLALVYKPKEPLVFKVFYDIDDLPEGFSRDDVYPLTYEELIYLSNYRGWNDLRVISTRYPITNEGSSYVSKVYVRTTVNSESRVELDESWEPMEAKGNTALVYPVFEPEQYIDSAMVHPYRLEGLGGDYDGDTISNNILYTREAIEEVDNFLNSRAAHVDPAGGLRGSASIDTSALVMHNITGE
jgi:hypothetical protein